MLTNHQTQPTAQQAESQANDLAEVNGPDEIDEVIAALSDLLGRVASPVLHACLEEARDDIAHLAGRDDGPNDNHQVPAAA
jgi:hypothetical protein